MDRAVGGDAKFRLGQQHRQPFATRFDDRHPAVGQTFVIITGGIDLSVGAVVGFCTVITAMMINADTRSGWPW
jgi:hypothetical protein